MSNPLLEGIKLPGRIFQLPSQGIFYKNGELSEDIKNGEIHVKAMSALDEINMKNPDQLFSGDAVNTVFKHCIDGVLKPTELLSKDIDAILLFLRTVTFGPDYEFLAAHNCKDSKEHTYSVNVDQMIGEMKVIDPTLISDIYTVKLPNGQVVKLKPNKYSQVLEIIKSNANKTELTVKEQQDNLMAMLLGVVESVNDITDREQIKEWAGAISTPLVNKIANKIEGINRWGTDLTAKCKCKDCGEVFDVEIPINPIVFFTE